MAGEAGSRSHGRGKTVAAVLITFVVVQLISGILWISVAMAIFAGVADVRIAKRQQGALGADRPI